MCLVVNWIEIEPSGRRKWTNWWTVRTGPLAAADKVWRIKRPTNLFLPFFLLMFQRKIPRQLHGRCTGTAFWTIICGHSVRRNFFKVEPLWFTSKTGNEVASEFNCFLCRRTSNSNGGWKDIKRIRPGGSTSALSVECWWMGYVLSWLPCSSMVAWRVLLPVHSWPPIQTLPLRNQSWFA